MKNVFVLISALFLVNFCANVVMAEDTILHTTFQIEPDMELMISHEFYKGVKIKGVRIKQVEVSKDTYIKDGKIIEGEPNSFDIVVELTDMKGRKIELFGVRPLGLGDYQYKITEESQKE